VTRVPLAALAAALAVPIALSQARHHHDAVRARLDSVATGYHARNAFDGVILVAHHDTVVYRAAFGSSDRPGRTPIGAGSAFPICSITKQFTALLVMRAVARGLLDLDAPVRTWLPELGADAAGAVTPRQLLTHTSGLPNLDEAEPRMGEVDGFYSPAVTPPPDARAVARRYARKAAADTGRPGFRYNNLDFILLQALLEAVHDRDFATILRDDVLRPLGMSHSGIVTPGDAGRLVPGYDSGASGVARKDGWLLERYGAAGAMYSTLDDLLTWDRALLAHRLLDSSSTRRMFTGDPVVGFVALGSFVYEVPRPAGGTVDVVDRQGNIGAWQADNLLVPAEGWIVIVLANTAHAELGAAYRGEGLVADLLRVLLAPS
jgi:CubicO group peptidase (beta-lactamase class C family)